MDAERLNELATNAQLDHWPPHLGVRTDAEKIEYLAERLREVVDAETRADELADQLETAQAENQLIKDENSDLEQQVKTLKSDVKRLADQIQAVRDIVA